VQRPSLIRSLLAAAIAGNGAKVRGTKPRPGVDGGYVECRPICKTATGTVAHAVAVHREIVECVAIGVYQDVAEAAGCQAYIAFVSRCSFFIIFARLEGD